MPWLTLGVLAACTDPVAGESGDSALDPRLELGPVQRCEQPGELAYAEVGQAQGLVPPGVVPEHMEDAGTLLLTDLDGDGHPELLHGWFDEFLLVHGLGGPEPWSERLPFGVAGLVVLPETGHLAFLSEGLFTVDPGSWTVKGLVEGEIDGRLRSPSVGDFDGDGVPDLFVPRGHPEDPAQRTDLVLWGRGGDAFVLEELPVSLSGEAFDSQALDWNGDGLLDVYVDNDRGETRGHNQLFLGGAEGLEAATDQCGACNLAHSGMGAHAGDVNGDGAPDLLLAGTRYAELLLSTGPGAPLVQQPSSVLPDLGSAGMYWGGVITDVDNDGRPDLWLATGPQSYPELGTGVVVGDPTPPVLALQQADGGFVDAAASLGLAEPGVWRATLAWDLNGDGVLDLLLGSATERPLLFMSQGCTENAWLQVDGPEGTRVEVETAAGVQVGWVSAEQGYESRAPARLHLGLGPHEEILSLRVRVPGEAQSHSAGPLEARRVITVQTD